MPSRQTLARAAVALPLLLAFSACGQQSDARKASGSQPQAAALKPFYEQKLAFGPCQGYATTGTDEKLFAASDKFECARMRVPRDYANPDDGETMQIAVLRVPARGERMGSLLLNPGGPGGSGMEIAATAATALAKSPVSERFDLVGFDPRGVGASTPSIRCFTDRERDDDQANATYILEVHWTEADTRRLVDRCAKRSGGEQTLAHVGSREAVRDMDVLRAVLGEKQATFLGQSYGTRFGALYAEEYPQNVRAMVLDGAIDPKLGMLERRITQYTGFQRAFHEMAADCAKRGKCPLGNDPAKATENFQKIVRPLVDKPVPANGGKRRLTFNQAVGGVMSGLYTSKVWPLITKGIAEVQAGRGDTLLLVGETFAGRGPDGRWSNFAEANYAVNCLDEARQTPDEAADMKRRLLEAAPFVDSGRGVGGARDGCEFWPAKPTLTYPYATGIKGLPPTLTISITGDPTTPYQGGVSLAESLKGSMLTVEGEQHTVALTGENACVNAIVADYLIELRTPPKGASCKL